MDGGIGIGRGEHQVDLARRAVDEGVEAVDASSPTRPPRSPRPGLRAGHRPAAGARRRGRGTGSGRRPRWPGRAPRRWRGRSPCGPARRRRPSRQSVPAGHWAASARPWRRPASARSSGARPPLAAASRRVRARVGHGEGSRPRAGASGLSDQRCWGRPTVPRVSVSTREQADVAHALEVRAHGVDVQPEGVGDLGRGQRQRAAGQLEVDGVAGVVAQGLQHVEARRAVGPAAPDAGLDRCLLPRITEVGMAFVRRTFHGAEFTRATPLESSS